MKPFEFPVTADLANGSWLLDKLIGKIKDSFESLRLAVTNESIVRIDLDVTAVNVAHGLGAPPKSWEVVGRSAPEHVYEAAAQPNLARFLALKASGPVSVAIRFS